jgi:hypothetical protein
MNKKKDNKQVNAPLPVLMPFLLKGQWFHIILLGVHELRMAKTFSFLL